jgi:hypothetical protein
LIGENQKNDLTMIIAVFYSLAENEFLIASKLLIGKLILSLRT